MAFYINWQFLTEKLDAMMKFQGLFGHLSKELKISLELHMWAEIEIGDMFYEQQEVRIYEYIEIHLCKFAKNTF